LFLFLRFWSDLQDAPLYWEVVQIYLVKCFITRQFHSLHVGRPFSLHCRACPTTGSINEWIEANSGMPPTLRSCTQASWDLCRGTSLPGQKPHLSQPSAFSVLGENHRGHNNPHPYGGYFLPNGHRLHQRVSCILSGEILSKENMPRVGGGRLCLVRIPYSAVLYIYLLQDAAQRNWRRVRMRYVRWVRPVNIKHMALQEFHRMQSTDRSLFTFSVIIHNPPRRSWCE